MSTCLECGLMFQPKVGSTGKFCTKSCATRFNNRGRTHSPQTKEKISERMSKPRGPRECGHCKVEPRTCKVCHTTFYQSITSARTTCSRACQTYAATKIRSYQNGSRKPVYYNKPDTGETVMLESSWELKVAEYLDSLAIKWTRPEPMSWTDNTGKDRLYYPDFYLPDNDTYLDPKNPYCMEQDKEKMQAISAKVNIVYGPLEHILAFVKEKGRLPK